MRAHLLRHTQLGSGRKGADAAPRPVKTEPGGVDCTAATGLYAHLFPAGHPGPHRPAFALRLLIDRACWGF